VCVCERSGPSNGILRCQMPLDMPCVWERERAPLDVPCVCVCMCVCVRRSHTHAQRTLDSGFLRLQFRDYYVRDCYGIVTYGKIT
jgi:hypothetical protein